MFLKKDFFDVFQYFGLPEKYISENSIYQFAPVFKYDDGYKKFIVKKTKCPPIERALNLFDWTKDLSKKGVAVVTPVTDLVENFYLRENEVWVVYPFIDGRNYVGTKEDIKKSGKLLGQIHSLCPCADYGLPRFHIGIYDEEFFVDVENNIESLVNYFDKYPVKNSEEIIAKIRNFQKITKTKLQELCNENLPFINGIWDYKGNNLIFQKENPTLVDPDNAGHIPRLFDLALTLLLFHNELDSAPNRIFTTEEWDIFMKEYLKYSPDLTIQEKELWHDYLKFVFLDEALWLINEDLELLNTGGTENENQKTFENQKNFLLNLLNIEIEKYSLG